MRNYSQEVPAEVPAQRVLVVQEEEVRVEFHHLQEEVLVSQTISAKLPNKVDQSALSKVVDSGLNPLLLLQVFLESEFSKGLVVLLQLAEHLGTKELGSYVVFAVLVPK